MRAIRLYDKTRSLGLSGLVPTAILADDRRRTFSAGGGLCGGGPVAGYRMSRYWDQTLAHWRMVGGFIPSVDHQGRWGWRTIDCT